VVHSEARAVVAPPTGTRRPVAAATGGEQGCRSQDGDLTGLSEILWDRYGVAHVYAKSVPDLFYGFGWAQARSHGDLLAHLYALARGRAAEYYGPEGIQNDRWMAVNDVPARARVWLAQQSVAFRANLVAFAAGANAYEATHGRAQRLQSHGDAG